MRSREQKLGYGRHALEGGMEPQPSLYLSLLPSQHGALAVTYSAATGLKQQGLRGWREPRLALLLRSGSPQDISHGRKLTNSVQRCFLQSCRYW